MQWKHIFYRHVIELYFEPLILFRTLMLHVNSESFAIYLAINFSHAANQKYRFTEFLKFIEIHNWHFSCKNPFLLSLLGDYFKKKKILIYLNKELKTSSIKKQINVI